MPLLEVDGVTTGYGRVEVLHELSLAVPEGAVVGILGPNGVGKTTLLNTMSGTLTPWSGAIRLAGRRIDHLSPFQIARRGITLIPEGRGIFPGLDVGENLEIAARAGGGEQREERLERVLATFPRLRERSGQLAGTLSGGEQQMLALSRAFLAEPRVLLLDEISMGLAPIIVEELFENVRRLKSEGQTIVLVEQYVGQVLALADICYVMAKGRVTFCGEADELAESEALAGSYIGSPS